MCLRVRGWPQPHFSPRLCWLNYQLTEVAHADEVVGGCRKGENPCDFENAPMPHLAQERYRFQPSEAFLDSLAFHLTDPITGMPRRSSVDRTAAGPTLVLRHLRCHSQIPALGHEVPGVISLIGTYCHATCSGNLFQHHQ